RARPCARSSASPGATCAADPPPPGGAPTRRPAPTGRTPTMTTANLPDWIELDAPCLVVWGNARQHIKTALVVRITPTGQVVVHDGRDERRFMLRDFQDDGTARAYITASYASVELYPTHHPKAPLLLAMRDHQRAWATVKARMDRLERAETGRSDGDALQRAVELTEALDAWRRAKEALQAHHTN